MIKLFQKLLYSEKHQEILNFVIKNAKSIEYNQNMIVKDQHRWHPIATADSLSVNADNKTLTAQLTKYYSGKVSITYHIIQWSSKNGIQRSKKTAEEINTRFARHLYNKMHRLWVRNKQKAK